MNKKGVSPIIPFLIVVALAAIGIFAVMQLAPGTGQVLTIPGQPAPAPVPNQSCSGSPTPEGVITAFESINKNTKENDVNVVVFLNGLEDNTFTISSDNTIDFSPGDQVRLVLTPATGGNPGVDFYGKEVMYTANCDERQVIKENGDKILLDQLGTGSMSAFNEDDGLKNQASDLQAIGSGETVVLDYDLKEDTADKCIGTLASPGNLINCWDWNSTCISTVEEVGGSVVTTPLDHSTQRTSTRLDSSKCYDIGVKQVCDFDKYSGRVQIKAKSGVDPGTGASCDVNANVYSQTLTLNDESGSWEWAYRDNFDGNQLMPPVTLHIGIS